MRVNNRRDQGTKGLEDIRPFPRSPRGMTPRNSVSARRTFHHSRVRFPSGWERSFVILERRLIATRDKNSVYLFFALLCAFWMCCAIFVCWEDRWRIFQKFQCDVVRKYRITCCDARVTLIYRCNDFIMVFFALKFDKLLNDRMHKKIEYIWFFASLN